MKIFKKLITILFLILQKNLKPCGFINIFKNELILNQTGILLAKEEIATKNNGNEFSFFGWIEMTDEKKRNHPLIKLNFSPENNEDEKSNFFLLSFNDEIENEEFLEIKIYDEKKIILEKEKIILPKNTYLFYLISFDYKKNLFFISISGKNGSINFEFKKNFNVFSENFEIGNKFDIDIGCFTDDTKAIEENLPNCLIGKARNFNYFFGFLTRFELVKLIYTENNNNEFIFDFYDENQNFLESKDNSKLKMELFGENNFLENYNLFYFFKEENFGVIENKNLFDFTKFIDSPTFYLVFDFTEKNLAENFNLLTQKNLQEENQIDINLIKKDNKRYIEVNLSGIKNIFTSTNFLEEKKLQKIIISIIRDNQDLYIYYKNGEFSEFSEKILTPNLENGNITILKNDENNQNLDKKEKNDNFIIYQFDILENISGVIYNEIKNQDNSQCENNCDLFSDFENEKENCLECKNDFVLEIKEDFNQCSEFCSFGFKNVKNRCFKCKNGNCDEISEFDNKEDFFTFEKVDQNKFELVKNGDFQNSDNFENNFDLEIKNKKKDEDYNYTTTNLDPKTVLYDFKTKNDIKSEISLTPKKTSQMYNKNKNLYQKVLNSQIEIKKSIKPQAAPPLIKTTPLIQNIENDRNYKRSYYRNSSIEGNFKKLAKAGFTFLVIGLGIGLIGVFFICPYINSDYNNFYLQKFIQSFLMAQYIAFWILYKTELPYNLRSFLYEFYRLFISWHKIFKNRTRSDFEGSVFEKYYFYNEKQKFFEAEIYNNFVTNFSFILLIQLFVLFVYVIIKLIFFIQNKKEIKNENLQNENIKNNILNKKKETIITKILKNFEWKIITTLFLLFIIEATIFIIYSFFQNKVNHGYFIFNLIFSIIYLIIIIILLAKIFIVPIKYIKNNLLPLNKNNSNFHFIWSGLNLQNIKKFFQGIQYLHYFLFSIFIFLNNRLAQIIVNLLLLFLFCCYIFIFLPPLEKFWKIEQVFIHFLLLIAKVLLSVLIFDEEKRKMSEKSRWVIGFILAILLFIILLWNFLVLIINLITRLLACKKAKGGNVVNNEKIRNDEEENVFINKNNKENEIVTQTVQPDEDDGETFDQFMKGPLRNVFTLKKGKNKNIYDDLNNKNYKEDLKKDILSEFEINTKINPVDFTNKINNADFTDDQGLLKGLKSEGKDKIDNLFGDTKSIKKNINENFSNKNINENLEEKKLDGLFSDKNLPNKNQIENFDNKNNFGNKNNFINKNLITNKDTLSFGRNNKHIINTLLDKNSSKKIIGSKIKDKESDVEQRVKDIGKSLWG